MSTQSLKVPDSLVNNSDFCYSQTVLLTMEHILSQIGLSGLGAIHSNLSPAQLYEEAIRRHEINVSADGAILATTGQHTGRSPNDKYIVKDSSNSDQIEWGKVNQPYSPDHFEALKKRIFLWLEKKEVFVMDLFVGASPEHQLPIRVITTNAWHALFARNMFIRPKPEQLATGHKPAFTVLHVPEFEANPKLDETRSSTFVMLNFSQNLAMIGGTSYAGEVKKTVFTVMNYILPTKNVLPMHASANIGTQGDVAVFFGLSGTGKTTLSADASRTLIGDDEHGWSEKAVFNFEGGCYAKVIRLSAKHEPEIYAASRRFGTVLENVVFDPSTHQVDFNNAQLTENTRACYPIDFIPNASETGMGGVPQNVIMLTCDAYGVLPPISKLSTAQAMYHFLSGYTARVAGTEKGVKEPQATFSACFGAPFLPRPAEVYARLLGERINHHNVNCWLINTGWSGGGYGVGDRMPINITRTLLHAALSGRLAKSSFIKDGVFGLNIPQSLEGLPNSILNPREAWQDKAAYDRTARMLINQFSENFKKFEATAGRDIGNARMGETV